MFGANPGEPALLLQDRTFSETVPAELVHEVTNALPGPEQSELAQTLRAWLAGGEKRELSREEVGDVADALAAFAHEHRDGLGLVERLSSSAGGMLVGRAQGDGEIMSAATALALALQRILLIWGPGARVFTAAGHQEATRSA